MYESLDLNVEPQRGWLEPFIQASDVEEPGQTIQKGIDYQSNMTDSIANEESIYRAAKKRKYYLLTSNLYSDLLSLDPYLFIA